MKSNKVEIMPVEASETIETIKKVAGASDIKGASSVQPGEVNKLPGDEAMQYEVSKASLTESAKLIAEADVEVAQPASEQQTHSSSQLSISVDSTRQAEEV